MHISEIGLDAKVKVISHIGFDSSTKKEYETKVAKLNTKEKEELQKVIDKFKARGSYLIVVNAIKDDKGEIVELNKEGLVTKTEVIKDYKPYEWIDSRVFTLKLKSGMVYHGIASRMDVKHMNRRNNYRLWLGLDASIKVGDSYAYHNVMVKDISSNGVGVIAYTEFKVNEGDRVHLSFYDESLNTKFDISAEIVRKVQMDERHFILGCKFDNPSDIVYKYIMRKQIQRNKIYERGEFKRIREEAIVGAQISHRLSLENI